MNPNLVSVYLPTKNRRALLQKAVDSVLEQTHTALELIVVNDGSTDDTRSYLEAVAARDSRVRLIHNEHSGGAPRARNLAIQLSTGEFITGIDDDDQFHSERLAGMLRQWRSLEESGETFSALYAQDVVVTSAWTRVTRKPSLIFAHELYFSNQLGNQIFTRREFLLAAGSFDEELPAWQDLDAFIRVLQQFGPARLVDQPLYVLNVDARPDRISMASRRGLVGAYRRICAKPGNVTAAMKQGLFLQLFSGPSANTLSVTDLREFFRYGVHRRNMRRLVGVYLRHLTGRW